MDVSQYHYSDSVIIDRPPADVYAIVSDVTRIGELSPACKSATWDDPAQAPAEGSWFTGHNAIADFSWDTRCRVRVAEPSREFTFVNYGPAGKVELVRWGFSFESANGGTRVTESWQVLPNYPDFVREGNPDIDVTARVEGMAQMARDGIRDTLAKLKEIAEASG